MTSREPRVLVASPPLLAALARCEMADVPVRKKRHGKPGVKLAHLARLEAEIGARLHDDVLVLLAVGDPVASLLTGIESTLSIAEAAEDFEAPEGYVRIAMPYSDPIGELVDGAHGGPYFDLLAPTDTDGEVAELCWAQDGHVDHAIMGTLAGFIDAALDQAVSDGLLPSYGDAKALPLDPPPRLLPAPKPKPAGPAERARHPKFGDGTVVRRVGSGPDARVVVAFDEGGERTLVARFLEPIE